MDFLLASKYGLGLESIGLAMDFLWTLDMDSIA